MSATATISLEGMTLSQVNAKKMKLGSVFRPIIGPWMAEIMLAYQIRMVDLCIEGDFSQASVSRWFNDNRAPLPESLSRLSDAFNKMIAIRTQGKGPEITPGMLTGDEPLPEDIPRLVRIVQRKT